MKFFTIFLISLFMSNSFLMSQGGDPPPQQVIFLGIFGLNPTDTRIFTLTAQGTVWGNYPSDPFSISEGEQNEPPYLTTYQQTGNSSPVPTNWGGWDIVTHHTIPEVIGFGLYKMTTDDNPGIYFYYNTRDCHYSFACGQQPPNYNPDGFFKYQANENKFYYKVRGEPEFTEIANGQLIHAWNMLNYGALPSTNGFEDFWGNALVLVNNGNNRPLLVWGPYPSETAISNYEVYRDDGSGFTKIATVNSTTYEYTDNSVTMSQPGITIYYKVKPAQPTEAILPYTNTVNTTVVPFKIGNINSSSIYTFSLNQNYPNPFNPTTTIAYSIQRDGYVSLQVYDILGNEVATLVNERKTAGNFSVEFVTGNLPSGIYFYTLTSGNFTYSRKMILLR